MYLEQALKKGYTIKVTPLETEEQFKLIVSIPNKNFKSGSWYSVFEKLFSEDKLVELDLLIAEAVAFIEQSKNN